MIALLVAAAIVAGQFAIAGERFTPEEVLDSRAVPEIDGRTTLMVTLVPAAAKRLEAISRSHVGRPLALTLDGATLAAPVVQQPLVDGVVTIAGGYSLAEGEALARRISGKDPLPDEFEGE